jgi:hypothetical protein
VTYQRIEDPGDLPPAGALSARAREKQDLDFKTFADSGKMWEHAKDIAAFANSVGGVLLVGADNTTDPTVLKYPGLAPSQTVADVATIYEKAGAMCSPAQNVEAVPMKGPGGVDLVAINVDPSVQQVVGSPGNSRLWRFPIRRGSQTDDIAPEDLAMYMNQQVRRAYLMVSAIPAEGRKEVKFYWPRPRYDVTGVTDTSSESFPIAEVPRGRNFLVVGVSLTCRIPLADVVDVWEEGDGVWAIKISGMLDKRQTSLRYQPRFWPAL